MMTREYERYIGEFSATVSGFEQFCTEVFESEVMEKIEMPKFRKFQLKEIFRSKYAPDIPQKNVRLLDIAVGYFMLVEPNKETSTLFHIHKDLHDNEK